MTVLLLLTLVVLAILSYLLAAPFYIEVDSRRDLFRIRFHRLATARIYSTNESLFLKLALMGWHKTIDLLERKSKVMSKRKKQQVKRSGPGALPKLYAVVRSFKLSRCIISLDTGDMAMNGILFPWLLWVGLRAEREIRINFLDENEVVLVMENNFFRVLRAYIKN